MKLKELHIRNIASIEKADIDFEKDLNDAITGDPATIFLISGDTGAGKSVILDSISMALYKKTPRLEGVANKKENRFENNEGESIQVNSIEQYTRLGISEKDECYSEVVFEDNDKKIYHARLELGMTKSRTKDESGNYILKYSSPTWTYKTENIDWTKSDIEQTIINAVGLTYEQFGRMAMLAQGQFANFLTGDKKEREAILEQLTNTQRFTAYGEAIQSLFKKAKDAQALIQTQYDTEKPHTLTDEEVEQLTKEQEIYQKQKDELNKKIKTLEDQLKQIGIIMTNEQTQKEALQKKKELESIIAGEEYQRSKALFTDWDTTTALRQQLADLQKARQGEQESKNGLLRSQAIFNQLSADLADRKAKLEALNEAIQKATDWIGQRKQHEELFTKAGETNLKIDQYITKIGKITELAQSLKEEQDKTKGLKETETEAKNKSQEADKAVQTQQAKIDTLNSQRTALNPQVVNEQIDQKQDSKLSLEKLRDKYNAWDTELKAADKLREEINGDEEKLKALNKANEEAEENYKARKAESDKANNRLNTMQMSLNDTIVELRHRLHKEHTDICPLCGQTIDHDHLDDDFKGILTPLEQEQKKAAEALEIAKNKSDEAKRAFNTFEGELLVVCKV